MDIVKYLQSVEGRLRSCQRDAVMSFVEYSKLEVTAKALLVNLPTGAGKTGVIALLSHLSSAEKVLVICHRKAVKDQLFREISRKFFRVTIGDAEIALKKTFRDSDFNQGSGVYITSFQKLTVIGDEELGKVQDEFDLIIVDEGHSEPSPVWREIIRQSSALKVVITATPYRNDLFELNVSSEHSYVFTFRDAVAEEVIAEPLYEQVGADDELLERIRACLNADPDIKCIVKCRNIEDIERYHNLIAPEFCTASVHERLKDGDGNRFRRVGPALKVDGLRVIIHQHKLDEGVDIPEAKVLVLTYELGSGRELVQAVGRVVRRFKASQPIVLDLSRGANEGMWEGYRKFDNYLSNGGVADFVKSLSTSYLIESFLDVFPKYSYFDGKFKERVDLNGVDPGEDIRIPLASVCFVQKEEDFSLPLLMDRLYWELHGCGALVKRYPDVLDLKILIYVSFSSSKFFSKKLFFEPSLNVVVVKETDSGLAVFDSGGGRYYNKSGYRLGNAVHIDKLTALAARTAIHQVKETHARAVGQALWRPETIGLKGRDLAVGRSNQSNSRYALTMVKVDNIGLDGKKDSSYYIGARSGRVVDQRESNFTLPELSEWIDVVFECINQGGDAGRLIKSYAQPVPDKPQSKILSALLDFSGLPAPRQVGQGEVLAEFIYIEFAEGLRFTAGCEVVELALEFSDVSSSFEVRLTGESEGKQDHEWVVEYINSGHRLKVLYEDGVTYLGGSFYRLSLPYEQGVAAEQSFAAASMYPLQEMQVDNLWEKGRARDRKYFRTTRESFDPDSIFYQIDRLKSYGDPDASYSELGPFAKYIPGCDLVLCCDMGVEPGDFILSSPERLCFVHVKCGKVANPQSSAGAIAEVGSQAIKNIHMLVSTNSDIKPGNFGSWNESWPSADAEYPLDTRYRLFNGVINHSPAADGSDAEKAWSLICERRKTIRCKKEIWIVNGRSFSSGHFTKSMSSPAFSAPESIQAFQLVEDWLSTADELDVDLKIFTSP